MNTKYPRTPHLPFSPGVSSDDKVLDSIEHFVGKEVVVTEKLDGECTGMTRELCHARSLDSKDHPSRHRVKTLHGEIAYLIPIGFKLFGENVYAKHSIHYTELTDYFYLFTMQASAWWLGWDEVVEWANLLNIHHVPVLYRGIWDEEKIKACWTGKSVFGPEQEGYVVRLAEPFLFENFATSVAKFVRKDHVQTSEHWLQQEITPNILRVEW
jgi:hypothetical protein